MKIVRAIEGSCRSVVLRTQRRHAWIFGGVISLFLSIAFPAAHALIATAPDSGTWGVSNGLVNAMVRVGDVIYLGGDFQQLVSPDGNTVIPVSRLAALDANTGQPTSWRPAADGSVFALAAAPDGAGICVGGAFTHIDGVARSRFAAVGTNGNLLWTANANSTVKSLVVSGNTLYMGGNFTKISGANRQRLAAIQPPASGPTALLLPWAPSVTSTNNKTPSVIALAAANGDVAAIGKWTHANGQPEPYQARFDALTAATKPWANNVEYPAKALATDGTNYYAALAGKGGGRIVAWNASGQELWRAGGNGDMQAVACCDGRIIVGGHFTKILGVYIDRLASLSPSGVLDRNWNPAPNSGGDRGVWALHYSTKTPTRLYVGGGFFKVATQNFREFAQFTVTDMALPSVPGSLVASAIAATRVDLTWNVSTDNFGVTGYDVYRDNSLLTNVAAVTSYSDTSVLPLIEYSYQVRARDAAGNTSSLGNVASAITPSDATPPSAPTNLLATAISLTQVDLSWTVSIDDVGVTGYDLYRNDGFLGSVGGDVASFSDPTAAPSTTYEYYVVARDAAGHASDPSNVARVTTSRDTDPPSAPSNLNGSAAVANEVDLAWDGSLDNIGVAAYDVYRDGSFLADAGAATDYTDVTVGPSTDYTYHVIARDAAGNPSAASNAIVVTTPP